MGMGGGGSGPITAHVHSNMAGQGGNLTDGTLYLHQTEVNELNEISPVGTIFLWGGTRATITDWALECDGSAVSRTDFSDLFDIVGTQFGIGDGSTTFNLPDLDEKFGRGSPNASDSGGTGGSDNILLTSGQSGIRTHSHGTVNPTSTNLNTGGGSQQYATSGGSTGGTTNLSANDTHENRPSFQQAIYVIRF